MKIFSINSVNNYQIKNIRQNNFENNSIKNVLEYNKTNFMPTTAQYLAFLGGYSLDLNKVFSNLEDNEFPEDIQEMALEAIENPNNKDTLYDVHFNKYKGVLDCYSLEELKEKYPEFENVKSAFEVDAKTDSIVGKFQNGESEIFSTNEDLTLQLIKLYWGQGFSLTDLSDYIAKNSKDNKGINLHYAMTKKLNIPLMNSRYANVLKKSNKVYNEQFSQEMSIKRKEAREAKIQLAEGEAVVIPRGPLSEAHKKHISEGLKKHFEQNPDKIYEMSKRQKEFYENHPEKLDEMSEVMLYAWNKTQEGKSIAKYLSKFMKKYNITAINPENLGNIKNLDSKTQEAFKEFWKRNSWAKEKMSIAVKKGWEYLEEMKQPRPSAAIKLGYYSVPEKKVVFDIIPTKVREGLDNWLIKQGKNPDDFILAKGIIRKEEDIIDKNLERKVNQASVSMMKKYTLQHDGIANYITSAYHLALIDAIMDIKTKNPHLPQSLKNDDSKIRIMELNANLVTADQPIFHEFDGAIYTVAGLDQGYIEQIYAQMIQQAFFLGCDEYADYLQEIVDIKFDEILRKNNIKLD